MESPFGVARANPPANAIRHGARGNQSRRRKTQLRYLPCCNLPSSFGFPTRLTLTFKQAQRTTSFLLPVPTTQSDLLQQGQKILRTSVCEENARTCVPAHCHSAYICSAQDALLFTRGGEYETSSDSSIHHCDRSANLPGGGRRDRRHRGDGAAADYLPNIMLAWRFLSLSRAAWSRELVFPISRNWVFPPVQLSL